MDSWALVPELVRSGAGQLPAPWEELFGPQSQGLLVFAYNITGDRAPLPPDQLFEYRNALYGFVAVRLDHYLSWSRTLSPKWDPVSMPVPRFRELARPVDDIFLTSQAKAVLAG